MSSSLRSVFRRSWVQALVLIAFLWVLDSMEPSKELSAVSFQLFFAMLAPHVCNTGPTFAGLFIYALAALVCGACGCPITTAAPLPLVGVQYCVLVLATAASSLFVNRSPARRAKAMFVLYYLATAYIAVSLYAAAPANLHLLIWPILLVLLPVIIFGRMRPFLPRFWRMAPVVVVFIPLRFIGYCIVATGPAGAAPGMPISRWERLFDPTLLFEGLVLPLGPSILMAITAAVLLTYLGGWSLRRSGESEGRILVAEANERDAEHDAG